MLVCIIGSCYIERLPLYLMSFMAELHSNTSLMKAYPDHGIAPYTTQVSQCWFAVIHIKDNYPKLGLS